MVGCLMAAMAAWFCLGVVLTIGWKLWDAWQDNRSRDMEHKRFARDMPPMQYTNPLSIGELEAMIPESWPLDHALDVLGKPSTHRSTARGSTIFYELEKAPRQGCSSNLVFSFALYFTNGILCNWWPIVVGEGCDSDCAEKPGDGP